MPGGLIQLVSVGAQDTHITGNPNMSFFKSKYKRHTRFSKETIEEVIIGQKPDFGKKITCTLSGKGDLLSYIVLEFVLPQLTASTGQIRWINGVGYKLVKSVEFQVGGVTIDKQYGEWYHLIDELSFTDSKSNNYQQILGRNAAYDANTGLIASLGTTIIAFPLKFWFCNNIASAFPIVALNHNDIKLIIEIEDFSKLYTLSNASASVTDANIVSMDIHSDYIYLSPEERSAIVNRDNNYMITQLQYSGEHRAIAGQTSIQIPINFSHPVKELMWVIQRTNVGTHTNNFGGNFWLNYSNTNGNSMLSTAKLSANGEDMMYEMKSYYFTKLVPFKHHTRVPSKHIYVYSFALYPEEFQPSGTMNYSRVMNPRLHINFVSGVPEVNIRVYAINYNFIQIKSGSLGIAYRN